MNNLEAIQKKVRRLTRSPSTSQISDADLKEYINTFILYDFPEHLRLFTFKTTLTFYTQPNIDVYETNAIDLADPLYNFKNAYITVNDPVYIAGQKTFFTQSRDEFYSLYPALQSSFNVGTGNGIITNFTGTLSSKPILRRNVLFSSVDSFSDGMSLYDELGDGDLYGDFGAPSTINYVTGVYDITFTNAPAASIPIYAQTVPYKASRPQAMLYFKDKFYLRPVPDRAYKVDIETYIRPTALDNVTSVPDLEQHWQYIAYGAAKKIFEDRMDLESVQLIMPEFKQQELLCLRRTIMQNSNERVATIYTEQCNNGNRTN